jgi:hypothetical protein
MALHPRRQFLIFLLLKDQWHAFASSGKSQIVANYYFKDQCHVFASSGKSQTVSNYYLKAQWHAFASFSKSHSKIPQFLPVKQKNTKKKMYIGKVVAVMHGANAPMLGKNK